jgi:hypothetical protein
MINTQNLAFGVRRPVAGIIICKAAIGLVDDDRGEAAITV